MALSYARRHLDWGLGTISALKSGWHWHRLPREWGSPSLGVFGKHENMALRDVGSGLSGMDGWLELGWGI